MRYSQVTHKNQWTTYEYGDHKCQIKIELYCIIRHGESWHNFVLLDTTGRLNFNGVSVHVMVTMLQALVLT